MRLGFIFPFSPKIAGVGERETAQVQRWQGAWGEAAKIPDRTQISIPIITSNNKLGETQAHYISLQLQFRPE